MKKRIILCVVLMVFLAETSLLSADHQRARLTTQANVNPTLNNGNLASSYDNVTTHEGNLIIDGTQTLAIENCTYIQNGNVYVRDWGQLIIRNATFQIKQSYHFQYSFWAEDYCSLEFQNASIVLDFVLDFTFLGHSETTFDNVTLINLSENNIFLDFGDYSKINIFNFAFVGIQIFSFHDYSEAYVANSTINYISPGTTSRIQLVNSRVYFLDFWLTNGNVVNVNNLTSGFFEYVDIRERISNTFNYYDVELNKTFVDEMWLDASFDSETEISDSRLGLFGIIVPSGIPTIVEGLEPSFYDFEKFGDITLNRTGIQRIHIHAGEDGEDVNCTISDCDANLLIGADSHIYVINSVIHLVFIEDTAFTGSLYFENTTWSEEFLNIGSDCYVYGNVSFEDFTQILWQSSNVTRNYNVVAGGFNGDSLQNVALTLFDKNDALVWNGTTDSLGQADFNVTFTDSNYTDTLVLDISKEGFYNETTDIGFISDTPVSIVLTEKIPGDINLDREVSLADLVLLAQAYGSKPGDSNWNPNADINGNGVVDLADLVILARHYGQHYP